jgi:RNA-dependent RNA polymerase
MPCLYPGDFRKLNAVNVPKLQSCIRDCIVFPSKGSRPHPSEMSGSDLDGDKYWVSAV